MAVAPPFANLLRGITTLRTRKRKSLPVHRGQADSGNSGTTILNTASPGPARLGSVKT